MTKGGVFALSSALIITLVVVLSGDGGLVSGVEVGWHRAVEQPPKHDQDNVWVTRRTYPEFNDPLWPMQYQILSQQRNVWRQVGGVDLAVIEAWEAAPGRGKGVQVTVADNGVQGTHKDLPELVASASRDFIDDDDIPTPPDTSSSHGTSCAGVVASVANNSLCTVGIAPGASLAALRVLGRPSLSNDALAETFLYGMVDQGQGSKNLSDVMSCSYGPSDTGLTHWGQNLDSELRWALKTGASDGRGGKGALYVWAAGNGGAYDCTNLDPLVANPWTVAVGALGPDGAPAGYGEPGSSILTSAPTSSWSGAIPGLHLASDTSCTRGSFGGTSAAAPAVAGVVALMLEANPELTARDVQWILVLASRRPPIATHPVLVADQDREYFVNAAGFEWSHRSGAGLLDAGAAVAGAKTWQSVGSLVVSEGVPTEVEFPVSLDVQGFPSEIPISVTTGQDGRTTIAEHVMVIVELQGRDRDFEVWLTSPSGTRSRLLQPSPVRSTYNGLRWGSAVLSSVHFWGENPAGTWMLSVADRVNAPELPGDPGATLNAVTFVVHHVSVDAGWTIDKFPSSRAEAECGNGVLENGEECEIGEEGCSDMCEFPEPQCGNEVVELGEECDEVGMWCSNCTWVEGAGGDRCEDATEVSAPGEIAVRLDGRPVRSTFDLCSPKAGSRVAWYKVSVTQNGLFSARFQGCIPEEHMAIAIFRPSDLENWHQASACEAIEDGSVLSAHCGHTVSDDSGCGALQYENYLVQEGDVVYVAVMTRARITGDAVRSKLALEIAGHGCGDGVCDPEEDSASCSQDCQGPDECSRAVEVDLDNSVLWDTTTSRPTASGSCWGGTIASHSVWLKVPIPKDRPRGTVKITTCAEGLPGFAVMDTAMGLWDDRYGCMFVSHGSEIDCQDKSDDCDKGSDLKIEWIPSEAVEKADNWLVQVGVWGGGVGNGVVDVSWTPRCGNWIVDLGEVCDTARTPPEGKKCLPDCSGWEETGGVLGPGAVNVLWFAMAGIAAAAGSAVVVVTGLKWWSGRSAEEGMIPLENIEEGNEEENGGGRTGGWIEDSDGGGSFDDDDEDEDVEAWANAEA